MRAFIGTLLSDANQEASDTFAARLAGQSRGVLRPVPRRSAHVTHVFLGDVNDTLVKVVSDGLKTVVESLAPVPFQLGRPEVLRAGRESRLILANVGRGADGVSAITRRIVDQVRREPTLAGISPGRSPHVTLARFRRGAGPKDAAAIVDWLASSRADVPWTEDRLDEIQLIRSELTPGGAVYEVMVRVRAGALA